MEKTYIEQINNVRNKILNIISEKDKIQKMLRKIKNVLKYKDILNEESVLALSNKQKMLQDNILEIEHILTKKKQSLKTLIRKNTLFFIKQITKKIDEFIFEKDLKSFLTKDGSCHFELIPATSEEAIKDTTYQRLLFRVNNYEYQNEYPVSSYYLKYKMKTIESFEDIYLDIFSFEIKEAHFVISNNGIGAIRMKNFCKYIDEFCKNLHLRTDNSIKRDYEVSKQRFAEALSQRPFSDNYNYYK